MLMRTKWRRRDVVVVVFSNFLFVRSLQSGGWGGCRGGQERDFESVSFEKGVKELSLLYGNIIEEAEDEERGGGSPGNPPRAAGKNKQPANH